MTPVCIYVRGYVRAECESEILFVPRNRHRGARNIGGGGPERGDEDEDEDEGDSPRASITITMRARCPCAALARSNQVRRQWP